MSLGIKVYHIQDFIRKNETGNIDLERSIEIVRDICTAASFHIDSNILVDLRQTTIETVGFEEIAKLTEIFLQLMPEFKNKIATIIPDEPERIKTGKKLETCMRIKNIKYRLFTDYEKAMDWLSEIKA